MKIDFFETDSGMDPRAVKGGTYLVELINCRTADKVCLYIGESVWIASRCGVHLYSLFENAAYFGLIDEDLENESFILKFSVIDTIDDKKSILGCGKYRESEKEAIENYHPLTQLKTSDRQIRNIEDKIGKVQDELKNRGWK